MQIPHHRLEPIDPDHPEAGYRAVIDNPKRLTAEDFGRMLIAKPHQPLKEMAAHLYYAQVAAFASLIWEGKDVDITGFEFLTPFPDRAMRFSGGSRGLPLKSTQKQVVQRMLDQGVPYPAQQVDMFLDMQLLFIIQLVREGYDVETAPFGMKYVISGRFAGPQAPLDPAIHTVDLKTYLTQATLDWQVAMEMYQKQGRLIPPAPQILAYKVTEEGIMEMMQRDAYDMEAEYRETSEMGSQSGNIVHLTGLWLAYNRADKRQGIFFLSPSGKTFRRDEASFSGLNNLLIPIPYADQTMRPGEYQVELRTIIRDRDGLQTLRLPYTALIK